MKKLKQLAIAIAGVAAIGSAQALTIGFEGVSGAGNPILTSYSESGFDFTSGHLHIVAANAAGLAANGTQTISEEAGSLGLPITMTKAGGGSFSLTSLFGAEVFASVTPGFPNADILNVVGTKSGGGTVSAFFTLDGVIDGPGGDDDFEGFTLPATFTDLVSVVFSGSLFTGAPGGISLDDIVVDGNGGGGRVPEPTTLALIAVGLLAAARRRRT